MVFLACAMLSATPGKDFTHTPCIDGDTVKAVVAYGDDYLFRTANDIDHNYFDKILDSLRAIEPEPTERIKEILFYRSIQSKSEEDINNLIDSLFELDTVPFALIQ